MINAAAQQRLCANFAESMHDIPAFVIQRQLGHFERADPKWARMVGDELARLDERR